MLNFRKHTFKKWVGEVLFNFRVVVPLGDEGNCFEERNKGGFNVLFAFKEDHAIKGTLK